jgi:hypothetical protein
MALIARILGLSLLAAGLGAWLGQVLFSRYGDYGLPAFCLACIGAIVGAIAGAAREIVVAQGRKLSS